MLLEETINADAVLCNAQARSKKHCLEILSELLARSIPDIAADDIFERLNERERLGCTSLDLGVAFPHCRVDGLKESVAAMIKLSEPVDFDASDGEPVDLVFGLMVPKALTDSHYADIEMITALLGDAGLRGRLRSATTSRELFESLLHGANLLATSPEQSAQGA